MRMNVKLQTPEMVSAADISECGKYRYSLTRVWRNFEKPRMVAFGALNPSTADALINDQTIRKEIAFGKLWGMDGLLKWNCYAWRETSPAKMFEASRRGFDIIGPRNMAENIVDLVKKHNCEFVVVGWGTNANRNLASRIASRGQEITERLRAAGIPMVCLAINKDGSPQHPLYIPLNASLQPWGSNGA